MHRDAKRYLQDLHARIMIDDLEDAARYHERMWPTIQTYMTEEEREEHGSGMLEYLYTALWATLTEPPLEVPITQPGSKSLGGPGLFERKHPGHSPQSVHGNRNGKKPHTISADEVDEFLKESVIKQPAYHMTGKKHAQNILENGVDVTASKYGAFGDGFYTSLEPATQYGSEKVTVAVNVKKPFNTTWSQFEMFYGDPFGPSDPQREVTIRNDLLSKGFDAIIVKRAEGKGDWVIGLVNENIKVVI